MKFEEGKNDTVKIPRDIVFREGRKLKAAWNACIRFSAEELEGRDLKKEIEELKKSV